jgi:hypothetical protein
MVQLDHTANCHLLAGAAAPAAAGGATSVGDPSLQRGWHYQNSNTVAELNGVFFANAQEGWLAGGEAPQNSGGVGTFTVLRHTSDGGKTWLEDAGAKTLEALAVGHELKKVEPIRLVYR